MDDVPADVVAGCLRVDVQHPASQITPGSTPLADLASIPTAADTSDDEV